jgi:DNA topoisomerase-3
MVRILNVAEKPDAAKKIATILSNNRFRRLPGKSQYNYIFEFEMMFQGTQVTMVVTSVSGHLMELEIDPKYKIWQSCDPTVLMQLDTQVKKTVKSEDGEKIQKSLQIEARKCQQLYLWLDGDREGENIAFEVIDVCTGVNRSLSIDNGTIKRARFSEFTQRAVQNAINNLTRPNERLSMAVDARQEIDLRIGAAFTRFQTLRLQRKFVGLPDEKCISYGPCQFPTLGFVVQRAMRIKNFQKEPFWFIKVIHTKDNKTAYFNWKRGRVYHYTACLIIHQMLQAQPQATVRSVIKKEQRRRKPMPLNTVELQKLSAQKLHMSSSNTMKVAEKLYNLGLISYPRTETNFFTLTDPELKSIVREQEKDSGAIGQYATRLINGEFKMPYKGNSNDNAHPPIHPIRQPGANESLNNEEKALYELIVRHFLAVCSEDAIGHETTVTITILDEEFTCRGLMISHLNYLEIWKYDKWTDKDIPIFEVNETFHPNENKFEHGTTTPPNLLTESDLIGLMDKNGIGTDATIAQHIKTIQERQYARKKGIYFEPTDLGLALVEAYEIMSYELSRPNLRAKMEAEMNDISSGKRTKESVISENLKMYNFILTQIYKKVAIMDQCVGKYFKGIGEGANKILHKNFSTCGQCGANMHMKESNDKSFLNCVVCKGVHMLPTNGEFSPNDHKCPICNFQVLNVMNPKTNKTHTLCPYCFNNPPDLEDLPQTANTNGFRCFQCTLSTCGLSRGNRSGDGGFGNAANGICKCPSCNSGSLLLRDNKAKTLKFIGCSAFPRCNYSRFLPTAKSVSISNQICENCSTDDNTVKLIEFDFAAGQQSATVPLDLTGCILCDPQVRDLLREPSNRSATNNNGSPGISTRSPPTSSSNGRTPPQKRQRMLDDKQTTLDQFKRRRLEGDQEPQRQQPLFQQQQQRFRQQQQQQPPQRQQPQFNRQQQQQPQTSGRTFSSNTNTNNNNQRVQTNNDGEELCSCGQVVRVFTCKNGGVNNGRQFAKCPKPQDDAPCKYFRWLDGNN